MYLSFFVCLAVLILQSVLFPSFALLVFAPFLALATLKRPQIKSMALAVLAGTIMDLFSNDPMGVHALNYVTTTIFLYKARRFFLYEEPHHIGLFTALFSLSSTLIDFVLLLFFDPQPPFTGKWFLSDLVLMSLADGIYAMILFGYPIKGRLFWHHLRKKIFPTSPASALKQLFKLVKF